jgi:Na+/phosphate symporter
MSTRPEDELKRNEDGNPRRRMILLITSGLFILAGGVDLLRGEWLSAAFFLAGGFVFFRGKELERWPKAARVIIIIAFAALSVAMLISLIQKAKRGV